MTARIRNLPLVAVAALVLTVSACGGGGGGGGGPVTDGGPMEPDTGGMEPGDSDGAFQGPPPLRANCQNGYCSANYRGYTLRAGEFPDGTTGFGGTAFLEYYDPLPQAGTATYEGSAAFRLNPRTPQARNEYGDATLTADFAASTMSGSIYGRYGSTVLLNLKPATPHPNETFHYFEASPSHPSPNGGSAITCVAGITCDTGTWYGYLGHADTAGATFFADRGGQRMIEGGLIAASVDGEEPIDGGPDTGAGGNLPEWLVSRTTVIQAVGDADHLHTGDYSHLTNGSIEASDLAGLAAYVNAAGNNGGRAGDHVLSVICSGVTWTCTAEMQLVALTGDENSTQGIPLLQTRSRHFDQMDRRAYMGLVEGFGYFGVSLTENEPLSGDYVVAFTGGRVENIDFPQGGGTWLGEMLGIGKPRTEVFGNVFQGNAKVAISFVPHSPSPIPTLGAGFYDLSVEFTEIKNLNEAGHFVSGYRDGATGKDLRWTDELTQSSIDNGPHESGFLFLVYENDSNVSGYVVGSDTGSPSFVGTFETESMSGAYGAEPYVTAPLRPQSDQ